MFGKRSKTASYPRQWLWFCPALVLAGAVQAEPGGAFLSRLDDLSGPEWFVGDFAIKRPSFRTAWSRNAVERDPESGAVVLNLFPAPPESDKDFFGAEIQRTEPTHYGRYEVVMTAARGEGVISAFFTYTGPYFDDPHDEIDFEFLGRDTTRVWVTRFADGDRLPGEWVELGFDAAEGPHLYTFEWLPDRIVWYADGNEIFRVEDEDTTLPTTPGRIYISIWGGAPGQADWSGVAPDDMRAEASYQCISFRPPDSDAPMCSDDFPLDE